VCAAVAYYESLDTPLPAGLTPVYPSTAQLPQAYLRKCVAAALARAPLHELLPEGTVPAGLPTLREAVQFLHQPPPGTELDALEQRRHPAWQRLKFDELLAQQLAQARHGALTLGGHRAAASRQIASPIGPL
jgi:ATP-dependent DNA helicase RecG